MRHVEIHFVVREEVVDESLHFLILLIMIIDHVVSILL